MISLGEILLTATEGTSWSYDIIFVYSPLYIHFFLLDIAIQFREKENCSHEKRPIRHYKFTVQVLKTSISFPTYKILSLTLNRLHSHVIVKDGISFRVLVPTSFHYLLTVSCPFSVKFFLQMTMRSTS